MNAQDYIVHIGGIPFRPCSSSTLAWLVAIRSPLIFGGNFSPTDFIVFAWMHAAPPQAVNMAIKSGDYESEAALWGTTAPPEIFAVYTPRKMQSLATDLEYFFADMKTGFLPFPCPSPTKRPWSVRGLISTVRRWLTGFRPVSIKPSPTAESLFRSACSTGTNNPPSNP